MKILVLGSGGQLGLCLRDQFKKTVNDLIYLPKEQLDITDFKTTSQAISSRTPDIVINLAAFTRVDQAESMPNLAHLINHAAVENIAVTCNQLDAWLIHLSTNYVFDGASSKTYTENDPTLPLSVYAESKLNGELAIKNIRSKYLIIRTSWVFSEYGHNFLKTMLSMAKAGRQLAVVSDQIGCPTYGKHLGSALMACVEKIGSRPPDSGIYHYCGSQPQTLYQFATTIFSVAESLNMLGRQKIKPIKTADYGAPALRPKYGVLDCKKFKKAFNLPPSDFYQGIKSSILALGS